jgi:large subunit ribosomal protein L9
MKVLLIKDLKNVGKAGEIKEVSDGYGANYVIPQGYGKLLNDKVMGEYKAQQKKLAIQEEENKQEAKNLAAKLETITLIFDAKVGKQGQMIGSVSTKAVVEKLRKDYDISLDKRKFVDKYQMNAFGITKLRIELYKGIIGTVTIKIVEQKGE